MGRRDQFTRSINPAKARLEWRGDIEKGFFSFYVKDEGNQKIETLKFAVLAERHAVGGYSEKHGTGLFSNEIDNISEEELIVKKFFNGEQQELFRGIYKETESDRAVHQASYQKVVYAVILECDQIKTGTIVRLVLSGCSASAWFNLSTEQKQGAIVLSGTEQKKKGKNDYLEPVFDSVKIERGSEEDDIAESAYDKVEAYINGKAEPKSNASREPAADDLPPEAQDDLPPEDDDDIPF